MMDANLKKKFQDVAIQAALKAGEILKEGFETPFAISYKEDKHNLVTEYDKRSELFIKNYLHTYFPHHGFIAEESGSENAKAEFIWVIDPLDGTVNYAHGVPVFSVSIALYHHQSPLIGVVYQPMSNELFFAAQGEGAFLNSKKITVSNNRDFKSCFIATGFPYNVHTNPSNCLGTFFTLLKEGIPIRRLGSAAIDLAYVAAGRFDAFYEVKLQPWDYAAGMLLVQEAGGMVRDYSGKQISTLIPSSCIGTNPYLYQGLLDVINRGAHATYPG